MSYKDVICTAESNNATALPKNTDFFDSLNIEGLSVERTWVNIGDDCFSPKSNASNVHVDYMYCNGEPPSTNTPSHVSAISSDIGCYI